MKFHVIGGGVAGLLSSIFLARRGYNVFLYERYDFKRGKVCSGVLTKNAAKWFVFERILPNVSPVVERKIDRVIITIGKNKHMIERKEYGYVFDRKKLDEALREIAEWEGVKIIKKNVKELPEGNVVLACGFPSAFDSFLDEKFGRIKKWVYAFRSTIDEEREENEIEVIFSPLFKGFFGWRINRLHDVEIGFGCSRKTNAGIDWMRKQGAKKIEGKIIPMQTRRRFFFSDKKRRIFLIGNAAGHVKFSTGGGILYSFIAAKILSEFQSAMYEKRLKELLRIEWFLHSFQKKLMDLGVFSHLLDFFLSQKWFSDFVEKKYDFDMPTSVLRLIP